MGSMPVYTPTIPNTFHGKKKGEGNRGKGNKWEVSDEK